MNEEKDSILQECIDYSKQIGFMSSALLQRQFNLGYLRAQKIMEQMEQENVFDDTNQGKFDKDRVIKKV